MTNRTLLIEWNTLSARIFSDLIIGFRRKNIRYFILRNYEGLPEVNNSKDVDIIIEPGKYQQAAELLLSVFKKHSVEYYHYVKYEMARCFYGMETINHFAIHIDLIEGYLHMGFEIFPFDLFHKNTEEYNGFEVLNKPFDAIMLLYYKVIGSKDLKDKYIEKISAIYAQENTTIDKILSTTLSDKCSHIISEALQNDDYAKIINNARLLSATSKRKAFLRRPIYSFWNVVKFLVEKFYRIIICPRVFQNFIAVEGADGTGKSTFINGLQKVIAFYYVSDETKCHIYHHRPCIFPNLGVIGEKAGIREQDKNFTTPHRGKPKDFFSSLLRMTYYWLDYVIGVPLLLRKDVQFDKFTVYDRYIYDFLVDPHRSSIQLPYWLRKLFTKLVIQPRIVFVLLTDAETIYQRKQELTIEEINRQLIEFSKLAKSDKRFVVIDAGQTPEEMIKQAIKVIVEKFTVKI
jgi:thymidylate kinase